MEYSLKHWRNLQDMSQKELADAVGKSIPTIVSWEKGKTEPKASDLDKLRQVLKLSQTDVILLPKN